MATAIPKATATPDPDYRGSMAERITEMLRGGSFAPDGDADKAVRAVFDVVVGQGVGEGREAETVLPLGRDLAVRVKEVAEKWQHTMEVFGEICNNVYIEKP